MNIVVFLYGKKDKRKEEHHRVYSKLRKSLGQREGSAAALSQPDQEDFKLLRTIIARGRKFVGVMTLRHFYVSIWRDSKQFFEAQCSWLLCCTARLG